jgi:hypothetical protein
MGAIVQPPEMQAALTWRVTRFLAVVEASIAGQLRLAGYIKCRCSLVSCWCPLVARRTQHTSRGARQTGY